MQQRPSKKVPWSWRPLPWPRRPRAGVEITGVSYRANSLCTTWERSQFLPQIADVHVNGAIKDTEVLAQYFGQTIPAHNLPRFGEEYLQHIELCCGEVYRLSGPSHRSAGRVQRQITHFQNRALRGSLQSDRS